VEGCDDVGSRSWVIAPGFEEFHASVGYAILFGDDGEPELPEVHDTAAFCLGDPLVLFWDGLWVEHQGKFGVQFFDDGGKRGVVCLFPPKQGKVEALGDILCVDGFVELLEESVSFGWVLGQQVICNDLEGAFESFGVSLAKGPLFDVWADVILEGLAAPFGCLGE
jgi:hypothetical protein